MGRDPVLGKPAVTYDMVWHLCLIKIGYTSFPANRQDHGPSLAKNTHIAEHHCQREPRVKRLIKVGMPKVDGTPPPRYPTA